MGRATQWSFIEKHQYVVERAAMPAGEGGMGDHGSGGVGRVWVRDLSLVVGRGSEGDLDVAGGVGDGKRSREVAPLGPAGGGDVVARPAAGDACAGGGPARARAV